MELFSSFRGSLLPKQITAKKLHFRKHGTGKKTAGDAWRLVSCFPKLRSGLFEEQGTPYSTEWFQIDFNESEQVWEGPLVPFKINLELFSSFRGSLLPKQITGKKLLFRKHGTGKKTAGDAWRQQGTRENSRGRVKTGIVLPKTKEWLIWGAGDTL